MVAQLLKDFEDQAEVNKQLEKMGYNIGIRLIEDFLARSNIRRCKDFRETAEVISKVGFRMFLGITPNVVLPQDEKEQAFSLVLDENPLAEFVELPEEYPNIFYSNILCGVIRGALEMVQTSIQFIMLWRLTEILIFSSFFSILSFFLFAGADAGRV